MVFDNYQTCPVPLIISQHFQTSSEILNRAFHFLLFIVIKNWDYNFELLHHRKNKLQN